MNERQCQCGCGGTVSAGSKFLHGHWAKANREKLAAFRFRGAVTGHGDGYVTVFSGSSHKLQHRHIAERALGRKLPRGVQVHHVNEDRSDNRPGNLVICPDQTYHKLLHRRQSALDACGHADWLKCPHCGQYDAPKNLYINGGRQEHRACGNEYRKAYNKRQRAERRAAA